MIEIENLVGFQKTQQHRLELEKNSWRKNDRYGSFTKASVSGITGYEKDS